MAIPTPEELETGRYKTDNHYVEILKLHAKLLVAEIPHDLHKLFDGWQICYPSDESCKCSVIEHFGSYGHDNDRLEIMGLLTDKERKDSVVLGHLTARNVFKRIKADYEKEGEKR